MIIGIDPGLSGAMAFINSEGGVSFIDTPTLLIEGGKKDKHEIDASTIAAELREVSTANPGTVFVGIERVNAMPAFSFDKKCPVCQRGATMQGSTGTFAFGKGFGIWLGILAALRIPYEMIHPATWKKMMMRDQGKDKDASRQVAMRLFPQAAKDLTLKKHHGRADALLIAEYMRRLQF